jgi:hypothetical protein
MFKFIFLVLILLTCSPKTTALSNTYNSKEEVIQKAFDFISSGDMKSLDRMILTREEHNENFWNHVGERFTKDPGMTADLAFEQMNLETNYAKPQLQRELTGKFRRIQSTSCNREETYGPFKLHLGCKVIAIDPTGNLLEINGIRTVIELNGKFKLYHLKRE